MDLEKTDLTFEDRGATWLMHSNTAAGAEWIKQYIPANAQTFGKAIVIGHATLPPSSSS
jgi:hypothetical protein